MINFKIEINGVSVEGTMNPKDDIDSSDITYTNQPNTYTKKQTSLIDNYIRETLVLHVYGGGIGPSGIEFKPEGE